METSEYICVRSFLGGVSWFLVVVLLVSLGELACSVADNSAASLCCGWIVL